MCVCVCVCVCVYCLYMLNAYIYIHILHFYLISYEVVWRCFWLDKALVHVWMFFVHFVWHGIHYLDNNIPSTICPVSSVLAHSPSNPPISPVDMMVVMHAIALFLASLHCMLCVYSCVFIHSATAPHCVCQCRNWFVVLLSESDSGSLLPGSSITQRLLLTFI